MSLGRGIKKGQVVRATDLPSLYSADFVGQVNIPVDNLNVGNGQLIATGGKIGIGTLTPTEKLEVAGNIKSTNLILGQGGNEGNISAVNSIFGYNDIQFGIGSTNYHNMTSVGFAVGKLTAPTQAIDVVGNGNFTGSLLLGTSSRTLNDAHTAAVFLDTKGSGISGRFGPGGAGDYYRNLLKANASNTIEIGQSGTGLINGVDIYTGTGTNHFRVLTSDIERFRILADGKVGIGTSTPTDALQLTGDFGITGSTNADRHILGNRTTNQLYLQPQAEFRILRGYTSTTGNRKMDVLDTAIHVNGTDIGLALDKGNVGIGVATPGAKLEILAGSTIVYPTPGLAKGSLHINPTGADGNSASLTFGASTMNSAQAGIYVQGSSGYGTKMYFGTTSSFASGSISRMMIDAVGNVGIGNIAPTQKLDVTGIIASTGIYALTAESKFSLGTYTDPHVGTNYAVKASGGIATNLIYNSGNMSVNGNTTMIGTLGVTGATTVTSFTSNPAASKSFAVNTSGYGLAEIAINTTIGDNQSHLSLHKSNTMAWQFGVSGSDLVIGSVSGAFRADMASTSMFHLTATTGFLGLGTSTPTSNIHVVGTGNITGNTLIGGSLGVTGATTLSSTLGVTGATTLSNTLNVGGAATLSSILGVTGAATLSSTLGVTGNTTMSTLTASGAVTMNSTLSVLDIVAMKNGSKIRGDSTGIANSAWLGFYESNGATRTGFVGDGSAGNDNISLYADRGDSIISTPVTSIVAKAIGGAEINAGTGILTVNVTGSTTAGGLRLFDNRANGASNEFMSFENSAGRSGWIGYYQSTNMILMNNNVGSTLSLGTAGVNRLTVASAGQVGIATLTPMAHTKLDVRGIVTGGDASTTTAPTTTGVTVQTAFEARSTAAGADPAIAFHKEGTYTTYFESYEIGTEQGVMVQTPTGEGTATMKADRFSASGKFSIEYNSVEDSLDFIYN